MRNPPLAERILARSTNPARAAAIYGDLEEIAATRGRLWFWAAYARTLFKLGWRTPVAILAGAIGVASNSTAMSALLHLWLHLSQPVSRANGPVFSYYRNGTGPLLIVLVMALWFVLPYAIVRYTFRSRFARLTSAIFVCATVSVLDLPWISVVAVGCIVGIVAFALLTATWRRTAIVLAGTTLIAVGSSVAFAWTIAMLTNYYYADVLQQVHPHQSLASPPLVLALAAAVIVTVWTSSRLHRWLLESPPSDTLSIPDFVSTPKSI